MQVKAAKVDAKAARKARGESAAALHPSNGQALLHSRLLALVDELTSPQAYCDDVADPGDPSDSP